MIFKHKSLNCAIAYIYPSQWILLFMSPGQSGTLEMISSSTISLQVCMPAGKDLRRSLSCFSIEHIGRPLQPCLNGWRPSDDGSRSAYLHSSLHLAFNECAVVTRCIVVCFSFLFFHFFVWHFKTLYSIFKNLYLIIK